MLKTFCHASANDNFNNIMSYMCWKAKDKNSKLGMIRIMRSLQKMGWHVQWTLNWGFSHSVLIFKKGRCLETSMMHLSVASLKKMFMQVVPKREEELVASRFNRKQLSIPSSHSLPFSFAFAIKVNDEHLGDSGTLWCQNETGRGADSTSRKYVSSGPDRWHQWDFCAA